MLSKEQIQAVSSLPSNWSHHIQPCVPAARVLLSRSFSIIWLLSSFSAAVHAGEELLWYPFEFTIDLPRETNEFRFRYEAVLLDGSTIRSTEGRLHR